VFRPAYWLSKKARLETIKLQLEILDAEGRPRKPDSPGAPQTTVSREDLIASPHAVLTGIQGFIIRFIILYVAMLAWGIVDQLLNPLIQAHLFYLLNTHSQLATKWYSVLAIAFYSHSAVVGDILIFLLLGWSLLSDIARFVACARLDCFGSLELLCMALKPIFGGLYERFSGKKN
jgi:hypothetical protein